MSESLAGARSPFLQHGAHQPVRWMPWGQAAFERARREEKPILLDIGAVWCHWCHVMDRESYENAETAALINELFVAVKVDRDERPDVDTRYQRAVQTLTGQGGWPLTAFLTPDGRTFYGGTYFPPDERYGRPSFRRVLGEVARIWRDERPRALQAVESIAERLTAYAQAEAQPGELSGKLITDTVEDFAQAFDFRFGGFGRAPKFPNAGAIMLLLDHDLDTSEGWSRRLVVETLEAMARGGMYDQLGGGFHRYSVDARWIIPHFEKMSYDNGPLLDAYARAYAAYGSEELRDVAEGIIAHYHDIAPKLLEGGGFPASQDADYSPDDDGDYWTWTADEIAAAVQDERAREAIMLHYGIGDPASSMHLDPQRHVLFRAVPVEEIARRTDFAISNIEGVIATASRELKRVRDARPRPFVDETVYTGWTGLLVSGHLAAARHLGDDAPAHTALRALDRIWGEAFSAERGLSHRVGDRDAGEHLDDHAHVMQACLDAFEFTQDAKWLDRARQLETVTEARFLDPANGAYRDRPSDADAPVAGLDEPSFSIADSPVPSGNAVLALSLLRLAAFTNDERYRKRAERTLRAFAGAAPRLGTSAATYMRAVAWATQPLTSVVIVGSGQPRGDPLLRTALRAYRPRMTVRWFDAGEEVSGEMALEIAAMLTGESPRAYVCVGHACLPPITDATALTHSLRPHAGG